MNIVENIDKSFIIDDIKNKPTNVKLHKNKNFVQPDFICLAIGIKKSGKTTSIIRYLNHCIKHKVFDKIILISPTVNNQTNNTFNDIPSDKIEIYKPDEIINMPMFIKKTITRLNQNYINRQNLINVINKIGYDLDESKLDLLNDEERDFYNLVKNNELEYDENICKIVFLFDDNQRARFIDDDVFTNLVLGHRHLCNGLGCSMIFLNQVFNRFNVSIRKQCTFFILFKTKSDSELKHIWEEMFSKYYTYQEFLHIVKYIWQEPFSFLLADFERDDNHMLRKNFNTYLTLV